MTVTVLALLAGAVVGLALGALGGGGSVLAVPALIYLLGFTPVAATTASLVIVAVTSATALSAHARDGHVQWRTGLLFAAAGVVPAMLGGLLAARLPGRVLTLAFAVVAVAAGLRMLGVRVRALRRSRGVPGEAGRPSGRAAEVLRGLGGGSAVLRRLGGRPEMLRRLGGRAAEVLRGPDRGPAVLRRLGGRTAEVPRGPGGSPVMLRRLAEVLRRLSGRSAVVLRWLSRPPVLRRLRGRPEKTPRASTSVRPDRASAPADGARALAPVQPARASTPVHPVRASVAGAGLGAVTGVLGVGGGFLAVPALVSVLGLRMRAAVGTSLLVITVNSLAALALRAGTVQGLDWSRIAPFAGAALLGAWDGRRLSARFSGPGLQRAFAWVLLGVAGVMLLDGVV